MDHYSVYISIGSNLGDPIKNCCEGIDALCRQSDIELLVNSPFYRTEPVDYIEQGWFVNAALLVRTQLTPQALLAKTKSIQKFFGRKNNGLRFGPRTLDLDIIFYGDLIVELPDLVIPHPRMHKRRFVLQPICDIDPTVIHPRLGKNVQDLLNQLVTGGQDIIPCS